LSLNHDLALSVDMRTRLMTRRLHHRGGDPWTH
jgi:hypothetical protein